MKKFLIMVCFAISCFFVYTLNTNAATISESSITYYYRGQSFDNYISEYNCDNNIGNLCAPSSANYNVGSFMLKINKTDIMITKDKLYDLTFSFSTVSSQYSNIRNILVMNSSTQVINWEIVSTGTITTIQAKFRASASTDTLYIGVSLINNISYNNPLMFAFSRTYYLEEDENYELVEEQKITNEKLENVDSSIKSQTEQQQKNHEETINTLKDDDTSGASSEASEFFSGFETDTFGLTSIITAPLNLIGSITSSSCAPLGLEVPFVDTTLNLPCMTSIYEEYFGGFLTVYQTITFGIIAYWVCVRIFALVKDFKNPDHDEIEVMDL